VTSYCPEFLPAYLSNGLIGMRVGRIPLTDGICVVNGLVQRDPVEDGEGFARGPYPLGGDIQVDGHHLIFHPPQQVVFLEQAYDFSCGELHASFTFRPASTATRVDVLVFCSRSLPTLVLHELTVEVDAECELVLASGLDPTGVAGGWVARRTQTPGSEVPTVDGLMEWETSGSLSTCGAAYVTSLTGAEGVERRVEDLDTLAPLRTSYTFRARPGRRYVLRQVSSLISSQLHSEPDRQAVRMAYLGATRGFDTLRQQNRAAWAEIWKGRLLLHGADERWQGIADASFYYLQASAHHSSLFSTSMFGLASWTNYHYYRGHVMWDIECFALPALLLTNPPTARALLGYRLERLRAAARNAAMNGYQGLQFPWAASPAHGEEVVSLRRPLLAVFEQHANMVVAFAFAQYCHATGDEQFLREQAWPVLSGVAAWITSRVVETPRGVEIRECLGIAEQEGPVDNHAYINMAAAVVLREAARAARHLSVGGAERWEHLADRMFVAVDERTNVILNHEGYVYRENDVAAATPETLVGFFPFTYQPGPERERATLRFYLERIGAYVGYPMLSAPLGAWAARLGDRALSARLFEEGYAEFIEEPFRVTNEFSRRFPDRPRAGPLVANIGGFLTSCLLGLTGIVLGPEEPQAWCRREAVMPSLWEGIEVERIWVRGRPARLVARHGARARIEPLS
jgi:trehalose/maltose hydrolase-like predicted phosphorylase